MTDVVDVARREWMYAHWDEMMNPAANFRAGWEAAMKNNEEDTVSTQPQSNLKQGLAQYIGASIHGGWPGDFQVWETYVDPNGHDGYIEVSGTTPDNEAFSAYIQVLQFELEED